MPNPPGYITAYHRERHAARMAEAREQLGGRCAGCGSTDGPLDFDHIDPTTKIIAISWMNGHGNDAFWAEVAKCQLLCHECHAEKTARERGYQRGAHGTATSYSKKKCRCGECRAWNTRRGARQRARKKESA